MLLKHQGFITPIFISCLKSVYDANKYKQMIPNLLYFIKWLG